MMMHQKDSNGGESSSAVAAAIHVADMRICD